MKDKKYYYIIIHYSHKITISKHHFYLHIAKFSIQLPFAIFINKFQSQFLKYMSLNLQRCNYFYYDEFYIVFFRVIHSLNLHIIGFNKKEFNENHKIVYIIKK